VADGDEFDAEAWLRQQLGKEPVAPEPAPEPTEPPALVEPPPPPSSTDLPTQAMDIGVFEASVVDPPPEQPAFRSRRELRNAGALDPALEGTEVLGVGEAIGVPVPPGEGTEPPPPAELESIFGAGAFQDYEDAPLITRPQAKAVEVYQKPPRAGMGRTQKVLLAVAGGLVGVLALIALFLVGTRISGWFGPSPAVVASPTPTPTPTATALPLGPLPPGTYAWDELLGTECLEPYESPWQEQYTVVDCTQPHAAQLVKRGTFTEDTTYPGLEELASRMNLLCTDPSVIDYGLTAGITDLQFAASYAPNATEWQQGQHDYFCFVNRAGGTPLTTTIAKPPVAPAPAG
jgi:hypothetical protein